MMRGSNSYKEGDSWDAFASPLRCIGLQPQLAGDGKGRWASGTPGPAFPALHNARWEVLECLAYNRSPDRVTDLLCPVLPFLLLPFLSPCFIYLCLICLLQIFSTCSLPIANELSGCLSICTGQSTERLPLAEHAITSKKRCKLIMWRILGFEDKNRGLNI